MSLPRPSPRFAPLFVSAALLAVAGGVAAKAQETATDAERRIGPWLELNEGGIAGGNPQGLVVIGKDGASSGAYGRLERGTLLPAAGDGFERVGPASINWGTGFMISLLENAAKAFHDEHPADTVRIGIISQATGGHFPPHLSHQNGLDADILFMGARDWGSMLEVDPGHPGHRKVSARFDVAKNWAFWRLLTHQRIVRRGREESVVSMILVAPELKAHLDAWAAADPAILRDPLNREVIVRLQPTPGHDNHFHLRLHCSPYHTECTGA